MGYFASIARHSGLQISGQHQPTRRSSAARPELLAPLDVEETVMVPPATDDAPMRVPAGEPHPTVDHDSTPAPIESRRAGDPAPAAIPLPNPLPPTQPPPAAPRGEHIEMPEADPLPVAARLVTPQGTDAPTPIAAALPQANPTLSARIPEQPVQTDEHRTEFRPRIEKAPAYFTRTAELLAAAAPDPAETQTVMLREVHEWIADGPVAAAARIEPPAPSAPIVMAGDEAPRPPREPGVRRIRTSHDPVPVIESAAAQASIEEQRLELSIGTISVVIEGEGRMRPPAHTPPERQIERPSPPRRTPRLRRHYL